MDGSFAEADVNNETSYSPGYLGNDDNDDPCNLLDDMMMIDAMLDGALMTGMGKNGVEDQNDSDISSMSPSVFSSFNYSGNGDDVNSLAMDGSHLGENGLNLISQQQGIAGGMNTQGEVQALASKGPTPCPGRS